MRTSIFHVLSCGLLLWLPTVVQGQTEAPEASAQERIRALEERVRLLEKLLADKDVKIHNLEQAQRQTESVPTPAPTQPTPPAEAVNPLHRIPGQLFQFPGGVITPEQLQQLQDEMEKFMQRNLDDDNFFNNWNEDMDRFRQSTPIRPRRIPPLTDRRPRLGASLKDADPELRERFANNALDGAFVIEIVPETAAAEAGFKVGDCIVEFNGRPIKSAQDVVEMVQQAPAGEQRIIVLRNGNKVALKPVLAEAVPPRAVPQGPPVPGVRMQRSLEIYAEALEFSAELSTQLELTDAQRQAMQEVLTKKKNELHRRYLEEIPGAGAALNTVRRLLEEELQKAEIELKETLSPKQLEIWRTYREKHNGLSISSGMTREERRTEQETERSRPSMPEPKAKEFEF